MKRMLFFLAVVLLPNFLKAQGPLFTRFINFGSRVFAKDIARTGDSTFRIMGEYYGSYRDHKRYGNYFCTVGQSGFNPDIKSFPGDSMKVTRLNSKNEITGWSSHKMDFVELDVLYSLIDTTKGLNGKHVQYASEKGWDRDTFGYTTGSAYRRDSGYMLVQTTSIQKHYAINHSIQSDGYHIASTPNGLHIITGTYLDTTFRKQGFILALDSNLNPLWAKKYDFRKFEINSLLIEDSNFIIAGTLVSTGSNYYSFMAWLHQSNGAYITGKKYTNSFSLQCSRLIKTSDSAYAMIGTARQKMWFMKTDQNANPSWAKKYRGLYFGYTNLSRAEGITLCEYKNQHYILAGECVRDLDYRGLYLVNTNSTRDTANCFEDTINVTYAALTWDESYSNIDTSKIETINSTRSLTSFPTRKYSEYPYFDADCEGYAVFGHSTYRDDGPGVEIPGCRCKAKKVKVKPLTSY